MFQVPGTIATAFIEKGIADHLPTIDPIARTSLVVLMQGEWHSRGPRN